MTESNIDASIIKRTQEILKKFLKKPPLTEKLLRKPPFRFLHDVFNMIINETGYFSGLYTPEELKIENIKDRDDKMRFLQKMIDVIKICTGANLKVRTSKIVAGYEAEKTNELLQLMGKIIEKKLEWQSAVQQVVSGKVVEKNIKKQSSLIKTKDNKSRNKTQGSIKEDEKLEKQSSENKNKEKFTEKTKGVKKFDIKKEKEQNGKILTKRADSIEKQKDVVKNKTTNSKLKTPIPTKDVDEPEKKTKPKENEKIVHNTKLSMKLKQVSPEISLEQHLNKLSETTVLQQPVLQNGNLEMSLTDNVSGLILSASPLKAKSIEPESSKSSDSRKGSSDKISYSSANKLGTEKEEQEPDQQQNSLILMTNRKSLKTQNGEHSTTNILTDTIATQKQHQNNNNNIHNRNNSITNNNVNNVNEVKRESTFTRKNSKDIIVVNNSQHSNNNNNSVSNNVNNNINESICPYTSLRPPSARPVSARPGAPRRRDKNIEIVLQSNDQIKLSGINLKLGSFGDFGDDDSENLVIIETRTNNKNAHGISNGEQQGHLVQQILETQVQLVQNSEIIGQPEIKDVNNVNGNFGGTRQSSARQMDNLRDVIQNLTKSVNPFGKLMDFIPEDIDAMQLELSMWRESYAVAARKLKRERSLTESTIEPMKVQLIQIEGSINEYLEMIDASGIKILKQSDKIIQMLTEQ